VKLDDFKAAYLARFNDPSLKDVNEKSIDECIPLMNQKAKGKVVTRFITSCSLGNCYQPLERTHTHYFLP
jgi:hypothetical protein